MRFSYKKDKKSIISTYDMIGFRDKKILYVVLFFVWQVGALNMAFPQAKEDDLYLRQIAKETWNFLDWNVSEKTGLPYDAYPRYNKYTSVTNIGFYLASIVGAHAFGFIDYNEALSKATKTLNHIKLLQTRSGFQQSWNNTDTLEVNPNDPWISTLDSANFTAGLILLKEYIPELSSICDELINNMKWTDLFDKRKNLLYGGMKLSDGEINANWHLELMGSDSRMAYVIAIGSKQIPASSWNSILRTKETMYGQEYFTPGWQGGGLFMQYIAGLFIDERQTILGQSAAQFAYAQILHQKMLSCNLWGWSASVNPDGGYIGWGQITDDVITPHASILGIHFFPQEVMANLKKMDDLLLRQPVRIQDEELLLGYADAYDWKNKKMAYERLVLDQSMLFLTLTNYLLDGIIWKTFAKNKWIQNAIKEIADLRPLDGKPVYANKGFIGMQINFSERSVSISLVNDSLRDILSSSVITKVFDETTGEKVFEKIHNLELVHDGKSLSLDGVFFDKMVKKHEYYIKVEWLDLDRNKICKADLVKTL